MAKLRIHVGVQPELQHAEMFDAAGSVDDVAQVVIQSFVDGSSVSATNSHESEPPKVYGMDSQKVRPFTRWQFCRLSQGWFLAKHRPRMA